MSTVKPLDLLFFALESPNRPLHMAGFELFQLPKRYRGDYLTDLVESFRNSEVGAPFDKMITGLDRGLPRWRQVEPDMRYHVRHLAVPAPGRMEQLNELVSFLNAPILDRSRPPWECYIIEGVENDRFAILLKVHHALVDGVGGMKLFEKSLNTTANSRQFKQVWQPREKRRRAARTTDKSIAQILPGIQKTAQSWLRSGKQLAGLNPRNIILPFSAARSSLNTPLRSNERRFAACDLPLDTVKQLSKQTGTTVNDVVMTTIDMGLQRYLEDDSRPPQQPLRVMMPMALQRSDSGGGGNNVSVLLTDLGQPGDSPTERLQSIHDTNKRVKQTASRVPAAALQLYTMLLACGAVATEKVPGMDRSPTNNLLISNMPGPQGKLYLAGARLNGFYGLPIVPPGTGLNVTFLSCGDKICLAIGANPEAVDNPTKLAQYIEDGLEELIETQQPASKKPVRKKKAASKKARSAT